MRLDDAIESLFGRGARITASRPIGGGCINDARRLEVSTGDALFVKSNRASLTGLFEEEARGLAELACEGGPRVPAVHGVITDGDRQLILLEFIERGSKGRGFFADFASRLATLHRSRRAERAGFAGDNHIGASPQANGWRETWASFFGEQRILFQVSLAERKGIADAVLRRSAERLVARLPDLLPEPDGGFHLMHGDLWGGNYMVDSAGGAVLIDPAVAYGHREADIAMTELFGGFSRDFYAAYRESWPLDGGYDDRRDIYNLYHLLNHANLFGGSYLSSCRAILRRYQ